MNLRSVGRIRANWTECGWGSSARSCLRRIHAAQSWFKERAKHIFALVTSRLATTIPRLAVAILYWALCIPNSNSDLKNEQKRRMFAYNAKIFGFFYSPPTARQTKD